MLSGMIGIGGGIFISPLVLLLGWATAKQTAAKGQQVNPKPEGQTPTKPPPGSKQGRREREAELKAEFKKIILAVREEERVKVAAAEQRARAG